MAKIRGKNSRIELLVFGLLEAQRIPFERHRPDLKGRPDAVIPDCRIAVFVDGDFWHGRDFASWKTKLNPRWKSKIEANIRRDRRTNGVLREAGWSVVRLWGKDVLRHPERAIARIANFRKRKLKNCDT